MRKLTDLFCLTIVFAKFNMLASFILHFLANIEGYTPSDSATEPGRSVSPIKYGGKLFMADWGQILMVKFIGVLFYMDG